MTSRAALRRAEDAAAKKEAGRVKEEAAKEEQAKFNEETLQAVAAHNEAKDRLAAASATGSVPKELKLEVEKLRIDKDAAEHHARSIPTQRTSTYTVLKGIFQRLLQELRWCIRTSRETPSYAPSVASVCLTQTPTGQNVWHVLFMFKGRAEHKDKEAYVTGQVKQLLTDPSKVVIHNGGDELASISKFLSRAHADDIFGQVRAAKSDDEGLEIFRAYAKGRGGPRLGASSSAAAPAHAYPSMADFEVDFQPGEKERLETGLSGRKNPAKVPAGGGAGAEGPGPRGPRGLRGGRPGSRAGNLRNVAPGDAEADGPDGAGMGGDASEPRGDDSLSGEGGEEGEEGGPGSGAGGAFGGTTPDFAPFGGAGFSGPGGGGLASGAGLMGGAEGAGDGLSRGAGRGGAAEASTGPDGMPGVSGSASDIANKRAQPNGQVCL